MISLSNLISKINPSQSSGFSMSNIVSNTYIVPSGNYWNMAYPNPYAPASVSISAYSNITEDACPTGWNKIPRKLSFLNIGLNGGSGNTWKSNDYNIMLSRYPVGTNFYIVYKGRLFRMVFTAAENSKIRGTNFSWSSDKGVTWQNITNSTWIDTSPDGQTINGKFIAWFEPYLNMVEVFP
jgi:hypothetical protein